MHTYDIIPEQSFVFVCQIDVKSETRNVMSGSKKKIYKVVTKFHGYLVD